MEVKKGLNAERDRIFNDLVEAWSGLEVARGKWVENPLDPVLRSRLEELRSKAAKLEEKFSEVYTSLYGSWYGIEQ